MATPTGGDGARPAQRSSVCKLYSSTGMLGIDRDVMNALNQVLFKRAIFSTGHPVVLFLSRHKVDPDFREARFKCRTDPVEVGVGTNEAFRTLFPR